MQLFIGVLCLTLVVLPVLVLTEANNNCTTPIGELGNCVPAQQCEFFRNIQEIYGTDVPSLIEHQLSRMACNGTQPEKHLCCPKASIIMTLTADISNKPNSQPSQDLNQMDPQGLAILDSFIHCGKKLESFLTGGGDPTRAGEFPWLVLLKYEVPGRPFLCGGSLITDRFVLTAAHCVKHGEKLIGVRLGEHNLDTEEDCLVLGGRRKGCLPPYEEFGIEEIRVHPGYKDRSINYDISLIKLDQPVKFKVHITPVCLPIDSTSQDIAYDQSFFYSGWGETVKNIPSSIVVKGVVKRVNRDVCRKYFVDAPLTDNHICAVGEGQFHTCRGDSGGPLFFRNGFKNVVRYIQYGIISLGGQRCGKNQNEPGVYASVIDMLPWITQNLY